MYIIHSGHLNVKSGGPALSAWLTIKGLRELGVHTDIIMPPIEVGDKLIDDLACPIFYQRPILGTLAYVPHLSDTLKSLETADIYHIQGVWMLHGLSVSKYARKLNKPYIVTLRGMLYPQALNHNSFIKKVSLALYQKQILKNAAAIQCTCIEEMEHYRALGFKNPVAIIPNPIETGEFLRHEIPAKKLFRIGYLGRLHSRKRIERLIYAMKDLKGILSPDSELLIIGDGDENYKSFLKSEITKFKISNVKFTGFLTGDEKDKAIESLSILVVPSDFENFGNIVTEALIHGVPVIASTGMPWQDLQKYNCGWWISNDQETINKTICKAFKMGPERLKTMGLNGRELIKSSYSLEALSKKMVQLYNWILNKAPKPEFVYD